MRWMRTAKQGYHERPVDCVPRPLRAIFGRCRPRVRCQPNMHGFSFRCCHGNRAVAGWVGSGGKYNKASAMAICIVLHICSIQFAHACLAKCDQIPSSQESHLRPSEPLAPRFYPASSHQIRSRVPQAVGRRNDMSPFPLQQSPGPRSHLDGTRSRIRSA